VVFRLGVGNLFLHPGERRLTLRFAEFQEFLDGLFGLQVQIGERLGGFVRVVAEGDEA
jgi:hypothetical protein